MLVEKTPEEVISGVGTDGKTIIDPTGVGARKYCGIHMQQVQAYLNTLGKCLAPYEVLPNFDHGVVIKQWELEDLQLEVMEGHPGLITGNNRSGKHCVAWDGHRILDPNGTESKLQSIDTFWKLCYACSN